LNSSRCIYNPLTLSSLREKKKLESYLFFMILTKNKYHLHIINKTKTIVSPLRDFLYIYRLGVSKKNKKIEKIKKLTEKIEPWKKPVL